MKLRGVRQLQAKPAAEPEGRAPAVALDIKFNVNTAELTPEAKEVMVGGPSKFGFDEERVVAELAGLKLERARIAGIQVYSASQDSASSRRTAICAPPAWPT